MEKYTYLPAPGDLWCVYDTDGHAVGDTKGNYKISRVVAFLVDRMTLCPVIVDLLGSGRLGPACPEGFWVTFGSREEAEARLTSITSREE